MKINRITLCLFLNLFLIVSSANSQTSENQTARKTHEYKNSDFSTCLNFFVNSLKNPKEAKIFKVDSNNNQTSSDFFAFSTNSYYLRLCQLDKSYPDQCKVMWQPKIDVNGVLVNRDNSFLCRRTINKKTNEVLNVDTSTENECEFVKLYKNQLNDSFNKLFPGLRTPKGFIKKSLTKDQLENIKKILTAAVASEYGKVRDACEVAFGDNLSTMFEKAGVNIPTDTSTRIHDDVIK